MTTTKKVVARQVPCDAVLLVVQRMESHPEEFALNSSSKWHSFLTVVKKRIDGDKDALVILEDFECEMMWNKYKAAGKKSLHSFVMAKILEGNGDE
jgi:hypothetical protein